MNVLAVALAKLAAIGIPAKATALGIAVAVGATGGVVAHATAPEPPEGEVVQTESEVGPSEAEPRNQSAEAAAFGQGVAADARDGGVVGQEIAEQARLRAENRHGDLPDQAVNARLRAEQHTGDLPDQAVSARTRAEEQAGAIPDHAQAERERARSDLRTETPETP